MNQISDELKPSTRRKKSQAVLAVSARLQALLRQKVNIRISDHKRTERIHFLAVTNLARHPRPRTNQPRILSRPSILPFLPCLFPFPPHPCLPFPPPPPSISSSLPHYLSPLFPVIPSLPPSSHPSWSRAHAPLVVPLTPPSHWLFLPFFLKSHSRAMRNILRSCPHNMSNKAMLIVQLPYRQRRSRSPHTQFPLSTRPPRVCDTETHRAVCHSPDFVPFPSRTDQRFFSRSLNTFLYPRQGLRRWFLWYGLAL
jgi:hypothetical protein